MARSRASAYRQRAAPSTSAPWPSTRPAWAPTTPTAYGAASGLQRWWRTWRIAGSRLMLYGMDACSRMIRGVLRGLKRCSWKAQLPCSSRVGPALTSPGSPHPGGYGGTNRTEHLPCKESQVAYSQQPFGVPEAPASDCCTGSPIPRLTDVAGRALRFHPFGAARQAMSDCCTNGSGRVARV